MNVQSVELPKVRVQRQERTWDRRAAGWDHSSMPGLQNIARAVLGSAAPVEGCRVVDLGCGSGQLTLDLARQARSVLAVDFSAEMLDLLASRAAADGLTNVETRRSTLQDLDLPAASVDVIVTNYALHHLRHPEKAQLVAKAATWLRPGGRLVIGDMMFGLAAGGDGRRIIARKVVAIARRGPAGWWRIAKDAWKLLVSRQECPASMAMWVGMLRDAGFVDVRSERLVAESALVAARRPVTP